MNIDIKHKHAGHLITIEGHPFKASEDGMWDLTEIWQTLKLPKGKQPGKFMDTKKAIRLRQTENIGSTKKGMQTATLGSKRAALAYAGWVSEAFEAMVYDAFEAILERPEVALVIAEVMRDAGRAASAQMLEREAYHGEVLRMIRAEMRRASTVTRTQLLMALERCEISRGGAELLTHKLGLKISPQEIAKAYKPDSYKEWQRSQFSTYKNHQKQN